MSLVATGGGLVFGGDVAGNFTRVRRRRPARCCGRRTSARPISGYPVSFAVDGKQYVAVTTGSSGVYSNGRAVRAGDRAARTRTARCSCLRCRSRPDRPRPTGTARRPRSDGLRYFEAACNAAWNAIRRWVSYYFRPANAFMLRVFLQQRLIEELTWPTRKSLQYWARQARKAADSCRAILADAAGGFACRAVTRDTSKDKAKALASAGRGSREGRPRRRREPEEGVRRRVRRLRRHEFLGALLGREGEDPGEEHRRRRQSRRRQARDLVDARRHAQAHEARRQAHADAAGEVPRAALRREGRGERVFQRLARRRSSSRRSIGTTCTCSAWPRRRATTAS